MAARELGLEMVPAIVRSVEEQRRLEIQIIENLQRKDLNALEEAQSYRRLMEEHDYTQEEVAQRLGKDQTTISQTVRVLDLPLDIQSDYVTSHNVSKYLLLEVARAQRGAQRRLWDRVKAGDIRTVAEARQARKAAPAKDGSATEVPQRPAAPVSLRYASPNQAVICSATFRDGNADERELLKVLQAWVRDLKKSLTETKVERTESHPKDSARHRL
jgi:ParB-like chromosome segregation protein Spo0J